MIYSLIQGGMPMKQWLIILATGIFLIPVFSSGAHDPIQSKKSAVKVINEKKEKTGWLGVRIADVTEELAKEKKLGTEEGAYVEKVEGESPADSAGIQKGDVIIEFDGKKISDAADLREFVGKSSPGAAVPIVILREGQKKTLTATLGAAKEHNKQLRISTPMLPKHIPFICHGPRLGMNLETLNEQLGAYFGAPNNEGVLVCEVFKNSTAEKAGFKAGDVIIRAGKKSVNDVGDIRRVLSKAEPGKTLDFEIIRKGSSKTIAGPIEKYEKEDAHGYRFNIPECPSWEFDREYFDIPDADIDIQIEKEELPKIQEEMNRLRDELGKMKIEKKIRVLVSPRDI